MVCGLTPLQGWGWLVHVPKATLAASWGWAWAGDTPVGSGARPKAGGGLVRDSKGGNRARSPHPPQAAPRSPHSPLPRGYRGQLPAAPPRGGAGRPGRAPSPPARRPCLWESRRFLRDLAPSPDTKRTPGASPPRWAAGPLEGARAPSLSGLRARGWAWSPAPSLLAGEPRRLALSGSTDPISGCGGSRRSDD